MRGNRWLGHQATEELEAALPVYVLNKVLFFYY
jgi:hypothetical protein